MNYQSKLEEFKIISNNNNLEDVELFVQYNPIFIDKKCALDDMLVIACHYTKDNLSIIQYLVEQGANIFYESNNPLRTAVKVENKKIVEYLISNKADITVCDNEPLMLAIFNHSLEMVQILVKGGIDIQKENNLALKISFEEGVLDIFKYLVVECGADVNTILDKITKPTPISDWTYKYVESKKLKDSLNEEFQDSNISNKKIKL